MARQRKIKSAASHRNGVGGDPFYVALFTGEDGPMVGIHFPSEDGAIRTAVLNMDLLKQGNIRFGENSWRGDHYHDFMSKDVVAHVDAETTATINRHVEKMKRDGKWPPSAPCCEDALCPGTCKELASVTA